MTRLEKPASFQKNDYLSIFIPAAAYLLKTEVQNADRVPNYNNQTIIRVKRFRCRAFLSFCWLLVQTRRKTMGLTSKENSTVSFFKILFWYNSTFFSLSWQLLQHVTARFQGRVRPNKRKNLKLIWKFSCGVMITTKFWAERHSYFLYRKLLIAFHAG